MIAAFGLSLNDFFKHTPGLLQRLVAGEAVLLASFAVPTLYFCEANKSFLNNQYFQILMLFNAKSFAPYGRLKLNNGKIYP